MPTPPGGQAVRAKDSSTIDWERPTGSKICDSVYGQTELMPELLMTVSAPSPSA